MLYWNYLLFTLSCVGGLPEQKPLQDKTSSPLTAEFDELVYHVLEHFHVPGLSIAVIDGNGNQTWSKV